MHLKLCKLHSRKGKHGDHEENTEILKKNTKIIQNGAIKENHVIVNKVTYVKRVKHYIINSQVRDNWFLALGWHLEEIYVTWAHLEKKWTRLRTYTKSLEELCIQRVGWRTCRKAFFKATPSSQLLVDCEIDRAAGGKLRDKNINESCEIIKNLALYDHERWNYLKDFIKLVKAISTPQSTSKTPDRRLLELEDQINFLLKGSRPTPRPSSRQVPQAYAEADYSNTRLQNQNEPPKENPFTFCERTGPNPQPQVLETTFEARVRDYMAAHVERMKRFENAIFKQREVINNRMTEMFRLLRELSASRTLEKTEKDIVNNRAIIESIVEPGKSKEEDPPKKASVTNEVERMADDEPTKNVRENVTENEEEEAARASGSQTGAYFYEAILKKKITKKEDIGGNFEIPCNIGGLKHTNALVDQGYDVNVMPFFTYSKLTNERPAETDIRLSLASHSYIYPLGIAKDVLVDVVGYVYPVNFVILDIKEDEKSPFILGTPFLTMAKAVNKFDKGTITLRSGKSKISFHWIPESLCKVEKGIKNDIEPIAPTMTVNMLVLEWEEKIKLHQEKEMKFDQWRNKNFRNKHPALVEVKNKMDDEGKVTKFLIKNKDESFTMRGDGVGIKPDGVASPAM
ncbi:zinc finger, CCHC-type containing protein [Tanacetum coccineum]